MVCIKKDRPGNPGLVNGRLPGMPDRVKESVEEEDVLEFGKSVRAIAEADEWLASFLLDLPERLPEETRPLDRPVVAQGTPSRRIPATGTLKSLRRPVPPRPPRG
jgi:hypothetical protein